MEPVSLHKCCFDREGATAHTHIQSFLSRKWHSASTHAVLTRLRTTHSSQLASPAVPKAAVVVRGFNHDKAAACTVFVARTRWR